MKTPAGVSYTGGKMAAIAGNITRFMIETNGVTYDISGYVTQCTLNSRMDEPMEAEFTVVGDGVQLLMDGPKVKTEKVPKPLNDFGHIPEIRRCGYCRQLNDKDQLFCGHCGGELPL